MTWERFGYICRKANAALSVDESVFECVSRISKEPNGSLYGGPLGLESVNRNILMGLGKLSDKNKARAALNIYGEIDLSKYLYESLQFKRVLLYLACVTSVLFLVSWVYQAVVAPAFLASFESYKVTMPLYVNYYDDYWIYFMLVLFIVLFLAMTSGYTLKELFRFRLGHEHGLAFRFFVLKDIRVSYLKIIDVLYFPLFSAQGAGVEKNNEVYAHLLSVENSDMSVATEMEALLKSEFSLLLDRCERQMRVISSLVAVVVVAAILLFMISAYAPLFIIGEVI